MAKPKHHRTLIAIVGGDTLLGREIRELLDSTDLGAGVSLFSTEHVGNISIVREEHGTPAVMAPLAAAGLKTTGLLILAGSAESSASALGISKQAKPHPPILDLTGALEDDPSARLRAPMIEPPGSAASAPIQVIAHPASIALALFLKRLHGISPIRSAVVLVFEPASERGKAGLDELQQQTVSLLSFKKLNKDVFDSQAAFNLLPGYGEEAPVPLAGIELKIDRHLASLLATAGGVPMPSLRLVQAPVFHGYSFSVWVEFDANFEAGALAAALPSPQIEVRGGDEEPPSNVGATGQSGITIGAILPDRNQPRGCWFWVVADNLRIAAENALEVAREALV